MSKQLGLNYELTFQLKTLLLKTKTYYKPDFN